MRVVYPQPQQEAHGLSSFFSIFFFADFLGLHAIKIIDLGKFKYITLSLAEK